jgi:hypothetical protein
MPERAKVSLAFSTLSVADQLAMMNEEVKKIQDRFYRVLTVGDYYFVAYLDREDILGEVKLLPKYDLLDSLFNAVDVDIKTFPDPDVLIIWLQNRGRHKQWVMDVMLNKEVPPMEYDEVAMEAFQNHLTTATVNIDEEAYK